MHYTDDTSGSPREIVDRENELAELRRLADSGAPALALVYGRRRVGKTYLLDYAFQGRRLFYFLAADTTAELNRRELLRELAALAGSSADLDPDHYPSWRPVFRLLTDLATDAPLVVVLDEFQYLMGRDDDIVSHLMAVWDRELRGRPLVLVLCGSEVAMMERLSAGDSPLYGRWNWAAKLRPFDYHDAAAMVPEAPPREAARVYGVFGGTPRFLAAARGDRPFAERVVAAVLSPRGEVHLQLDHIIEQEKGIRNPAEYRAALEAIAGGRTEATEVMQVAGFASRIEAVRRLQLLLDLELVRRERNFAARAKAPYRYYIADHAVRFWYRFAVPNRSLLETGDPATVWRQRIAPHFDDYMGKTFEQICREAFARHHARWGFAAPLEWSRWEGSDRNGRSIELDVVARLADGRLLTGEFKWSGAPLHSSAHDRLRRNLEDLSLSGQSWARDALTPGKSAGHIYICAGGFSERFRELAAADPAVRLFTLDDLYVRDFTPPDTPAPAHSPGPAGRG